MRGEIRWDADREMRTGVPEIIYGPGKTIDHLLALFTTDDLRIASRLSAAQMEALEAVARVYPRSGMAVKGGRERSRSGEIAIVAAGTADISVAEEAEVVLTALGFATYSIYDVGIAGLHRVLEELPRLSTAAVCVVIAGMDGALPGVVAGLIRAPVIAVPTSVGSGVAHGGMAALNTMLASCSPGVAVVNIDNGVGAALLAVKIAGTAPGVPASEHSGSTTTPAN
jgi:pyridinium-3,5-biscarboxylic acid mononucleotide synthase